MPYIETYIGEDEILNNLNALTQVKDGRWVASRRLGFNSLLHTIKCLWLVATGKADIVVWAEEENRNH